MSLPNLFLLAAPRSGSTQLARWLDTHPDIALSAVKEPNHFSAGDFPEGYVARTRLNDVDPTGPPPRPAQFAIFRDRSAYRRLFAPLDTRWRMDASTSYLACPDAPHAIARTVPDARVILLTRDPVARAVSHYRLALRTGRTTASLAEEIARERQGALPPGGRYILRPSMQREAVARVRAAFAPGQVHALTFEELIARPGEHLSRIAAFLGVPDHFDLTVSARNAAALPRFAGANAWLHHSGLKTLARRALPVALRPIARRLWFREGAAAPIPADEIAQLRTALEGA